MAANITTNFAIDISTTKPVAMGMIHGNDSIQAIKTDTVIFNKTGIGHTAQITPSGFPRAQAYMYIILVFIGVVNNCFTLRVLKHMPKKPFFTYLQCLAFVDFIFVCCVGIFMSYMWDGYVSSFALCFFICRISSQLLWTCAKASTMITTLLGLERVVSVFSPFTMMRLNSTIRVRCILIAAVVFALAAQIGLMMMFRPTPYGEHYFCFWSPTYFTPLGQTLILTNTIVFEYSMPIILLLCNVCLITQITVARVRRRKLLEGGNRPERFTSSADTRVTLVLISTSILSLISNTPGTVIRLLEIPRNMYGGLRLFSDIMFVFERTAHFYLYVAVHEGFRKTAKALIFCNSIPYTQYSEHKKTDINKNGRGTEIKIIDDPQDLVTRNDSIAFDTLAKFPSNMCHQTPDLWASGL